MQNRCHAWGIHIACDINACIQRRKMRAKHLMEFRMLLKQQEQHMINRHLCSRCTILGTLQDPFATYKSMRKARDQTTGECVSLGATILIYAKNLNKQTPFSTRNCFMCLSLSLYVCYIFGLIWVSMRYNAFSWHSKSKMPMHLICGLHHFRMNCTQHSISIMTRVLAQKSGVRCKSGEEKQQTILLYLRLGLSSSNYESIRSKHQNVRAFSVHSFLSYRTQWNYRIWMELICVQALELKDLCTSTGWICKNGYLQFIPQIVQWL